MMRLILYNWEFKLIALLLAISLYFYTSDLITVDSRLLIPVLNEDRVISYVPDGFVVTGLEPRTDIEVMIRGPRKLVQALSDEVDLSLELARDSIKAGEQIFVVNNELLGIDPKIKIIESRPRGDIVVRVSRQSYRTVPIDSEIEFIGLPENVLVHEIQLDKTDLEVHGPEDIVIELETLDVEPVDLTRALRDQDLRRDIEKVIPIKLELPPSVQTTDVKTVYAKVLFKPKQASREMNLPLSVLSEPGFTMQYRVEFASPVVTVTIKGPASYLGELKESELTAYVNLRADQFAEENSKRLPVYVQNPSWVTVGPAQTVVNVHKRSAAAADDNEIEPPNIKESDVNEQNSILDNDEREPIIDKTPRKKHSILPED